MRDAHENPERYYLEEQESESHYGRQDVDGADEEEFHEEDDEY